MDGANVSHPSQVGPLWSDIHLFAKRHFQEAVARFVGPKGTDLQNHQVAFAHDLTGPDPISILTKTITQGTHP
jgi:hypothetical protein